MKDIDTAVRRAMLPGWQTPTQIADRADIPIGVVLLTLRHIPVRKRTTASGRIEIQLGAFAAFGESTAMLGAAFAQLGEEIKRGLARLLRVDTSGELPPCDSSATVRADFSREVSPP